jgi:type 1 fimbria pilin
MIAIIGMLLALTAAADGTVTFSSVVTASGCGQEVVAVSALFVGDRVDGEPLPGALEVTAERIRVVHLHAVKGDDVMGQRSCSGG